MSVPPWHLWGNLEQVTTIVRGSGVVFGNEQQLCKVGYGRPDTWHWFFSARLISGPDNTPGFFTRVRVDFDVTIGSGRGATPIYPLPTGVLALGFEHYDFQWGPVTPAFPSGAFIYSTDAVAPGRSFQGDGPAVTGTLITQLPAEAIQVKTRVFATTIDLNVAALGQPVVVEVSSYWAPKSHVRPDWYQIGKSPHTQFPGHEVPGR